MWTEPGALAAARGGSSREARSDGLSSLGTHRAHTTEPVTNENAAMRLSTYLSCGRLLRPFVTARHRARLSDRTRCLFCCDEVERNRCSTVHKKARASKVKI